MRPAFLPLLIVALPVPSMAAVECSFTPAFTVGATPVVSIDGKVLAFSSSLNIDLDGAPNAYHRLGRVEGKALDMLCNAGRALPGDGRPPYFGSQSGRCGEFLKDVATAEAAGWTGPTRIEWFALATKDKAKNIPFVQDNGPTAGFYISTTALQDTQNFPNPADPNRYLDSRSIPYVVIPKGQKFSFDGKSALGDAAISYNPRNGKIAYGLVGDLGPASKIGEASAAMANLLRDQGAPIPIAKMDYKNIQSLAIGKPIVTIIFKGQKVSAPYTAEAVDSAAKAALSAWGGVERLKACAAVLPVN